MQLTCRPTVNTKGLCTVYTRDLRMPILNMTVGLKCYLCLQDFFLDAVYVLVDTMC